MTISVTNLGNSGGAYNSSATRSSLTQAFTRTGDEDYVIVVVSSSSNPDFANATIGGVSMTRLGVIEPYGRLQVFGIDCRTVTVPTSGNIVVTASSGSGNRSMMAWFGITGIIATGFVPQTITAGNLASGISPTVVGSALIVAGSYRETTSSTLLTTTPTGATLVFQLSGRSNAIGNQGVIGVCIRNAPTGAISWGDTQAYQVIGLRGPVVARQIWPRGGNVYTQP